MIFVPGAKQMPSGHNEHSANVQLKEWLLKFRFESANSTLILRANEQGKRSVLPKTC